MADNPTIVAASLSDDELKKSVDSLVSHVEEAMKKMVTSTNNAVGEMEKKLRSLGNIKVDSNGSSDGGSSRRAKAYNAETEALEKSNQAAKEKTMTLDQNASAINTAIQSEKKYTDEIRRQAEEIRKSKDWQEKGAVVVGGGAVYNAETLVGLNKRQRQEIAPLEEQLLQIQQRQTAEQQRQTAATNETANAEQRVISEAERRLQIEGSMQSTLQKSRDIMREMTAQKGGSVATFTPQLESLNRLTTKLKDLRKQYDSMTFPERFGEEGQRVARNIREITRETQRLQAQLSRPASFKEAMGLSEKTLDDIAYKVRQFQAYKRGLNITDPKQANELRVVDAEINRLNKDLNKYMSTTRQVSELNTVLGRSWAYMKNRLAFYFTVGASTAFIQNLIDVRSQYEMNERALGILINSAERGTQVFRELSEMALVSPYTLIELSTAAKQLTAYDIAAKDVVDTTRRLADISAAVGVPVERFTYALGQVKAFGHLTSQDARQFLNTGVPLVKELAKHYTQLEGRLVSTADVYDRMKKHAVSYNDVVLVLNEMTDEGGKFFDYQAKMAETLKVQLANLTLAWNNMLNDIGSQTQGILSTGISGLKELFLHWQTLDRILWNLAITLGTAKASMLLLNVTFGKGTLATIRNMMATEGATAANYRYALSKANISKVEAKWLLSLQKNNVALKEAIAQMNLLTTAEINASSKATLFGVNLGRVGMIGKNTLLGIGSLARAAGIGISMLGKSLLALVTNPAFIGFALVSALMDAILYSNQLDDQMKAMNQNIANGAKEASKSMGDFLKESAMVANRQKALNNALSPEEGEKTWNALREQIELSSDASETFISALLREEDINQRISKGFDIADKIREATEAMSALNEEALKVSQDSWLNGFFGEGVGEDLEDYIEMIKEFREEASSRGLGGNAIMQWAKDTQNQNEMKREMQTLADDVAQVLRDRLGEGISDPVKIREALERIKKEIKAANPQIRGEVANFFDVELENLLQPKFKALGNDNIALQQQFLQVIKRDYSSAFAEITDDILKENAKWGKDQEEAIKKAAEKLKTITVPEFHSAIDDMVRYMNSQDWRVKISAVLGIQGRTELQKQFDKDFGDPVTKKTVGVYATLRPKEGQGGLEYRKEINETIENGEKAEQKLRAQGDALAKTNAKLAQTFYTQADAQKKTVDAAKVVKDTWKLLDEEQKKTNRGSGGSKKDPLGDAIQKNIQYINEIRKKYEDFKKDGLNVNEALTEATKHYSRSLARVNSVLAKFGIKGLTGDQLATMNLQQVRDYYQGMLQGAQSSAKGVEALEKALIGVDDEIIKFRQKTITDSLNNELSKLKDEYELALELDADPELGNAFASMMGINMESLPHTVKEYADKYTQYLNKYLEGNKSEFRFGAGELFSLTPDDIKAFQSQVQAGTFNQAWFDEIKKAYGDIQGKRKKDIEDTEKWKNSLIEKYGDLQDKLTKIYKDSVQQQVNAVKSFGTEDQKSEIVRLQLRLEATDDPAELADINLQIAEIVKDVTDKNPIALKLVTASNNQTKSDTSKAYWEDFKDIDLYAMTFEDTANLSNRAIDTMIDKLEELKDKVKESPKDMEALIKAKNELEKTKNERNPFGAIVDGIEEWVNATKKVEQARERLVLANQNVAIAETQLAQAEKNGLSDEVLRKQEQLNKAKKEQEEATTNVTKAENEQKKASIKVRMGMENLANSMNKIKGVFDGVSQVFRMFGDDETADAIDEISKGFSIMASMIMAVVAAMIVLESTVPWLLAIAAALGVIVGLVSFLSGQENKRIDKKIKESELAVKRLENAYRNLEATTEDAYGAMVSGAQKALQANKKLQLAELQRQLTLERSRDSKHRDEDRIAELEGQIQDLRNEIKKASQDIVNELLGVSSAGDGVTSLVDAMIDAFRNGEDAMEAFSKKWDEMIDNMILKLMVSYYMQREWDKIMDTLKKMEDQFLEKASAEYEEAVREQNRFNNQEKWQQAEDFIRSTGLFDNSGERNIITNLGDYFEDQFAPFGVSSEGMKRLSKIGITDYESFWEKVGEYQQGLVNDVKRAEEATNEASLKFTKWSYKYMKGEGYDRMKSAAENLKDNIEQFYTFGQDNEKELSALQRGISSISEETAGAIEAYLNGMSQQVYYQSDILTQIRDTVQSFDIDVQTSTFAEMLLQLQISTQTQNAIRSIMEGWSSPNGMSVRVEMI